MPEPTGGQVIKWTPQKPSLKFGSFKNPFTGPAGKAKPYSVDFSVLYGYGEAGYKDVQFTAATDKSWGSILSKFQFSGSASQAERKLGFSINHPKSVKKDVGWPTTAPECSTFAIAARPICRGEPEAAAAVSC